MHNSQPELLNQFYSKGLTHSSLFCLKGLQAHVILVEPETGGGGGGGGWGTPLSELTEELCEPIQLSAHKNIEKLIKTKKFHILSWLLGSCMQRWTSRLEIKER
jgi:hypothetical protein